MNENIGCCAFHLDIGYSVLDIGYSPALRDPALRDVILDIQILDLYVLTITGIFLFMIAQQSIVRLQNDKAAGSRRSESSFRRLKMFKIRI